MARVEKNNAQWKRAAGLTGKHGAQEPMKDRVARKAIEAVRAGKKFFEHGGTLFVEYDGEFIDWVKADPTKIGKQRGE